MESGWGDYEVLKLKYRGEDEAERIEQLMVKRQAEGGLAGRHVKDVFVLSGSLGEQKTSLTFDKEGTAIFAEITRGNVGSRLAIVVDGELYAAPVIRPEIAGGEWRD